MKIKNSIAYDYDYKKELEALTTYNFNRIDKAREISTKISFQSDNAAAIDNGTLVIKF